jgi:hypothetical protein
LSKIRLLGKLYKRNSNPAYSADYCSSTVNYFHLSRKIYFSFQKNSDTCKGVTDFVYNFIQFSALVAINFSSDAQIHSSYYGELNSVQAQENFGLVSMTELDISHLIGN